MRRPLAYLAAWTVATAITAGISWLGIRSVLIAAAPSPSPTDRWTQVGDDTFKRTFHLVGGDVTTRVSRDRIQLTPTPRPAYNVETTRIAQDAVMVTFTADRKLSRLLVRWLDGPYAEVTESVT